MYTVTVYHVEHNEAVDVRDFTFGTWNEIGLWLDHCGYNDADYRVDIRFTV